MNEAKQSMAMRLVDEHESDDWIAGTRQWREEASATMRSQIARIAELEAENASLREPLTDEQWQALADATDLIIFWPLKQKIEEILGITGDGNE